MPHLVSSRYDQGRAAYRAGHGIGHLIEITEEIDKRRDELLDAIGSRATEPDPAKQAEIQNQREAIRNGEFGHDAGPSLIAGFADGMIADIRLIAGQRRGQTA